MIKAMYDEVFYQQDELNAYLVRLRNQEPGIDDSLMFIKDITEAANFTQYTKDYLNITINLPNIDIDGLSFVNSQDGNLPMHRSSNGKIDRVYAQWDISNKRLVLNVNLFACKKPQECE